ncbi:MAG: hypothetical protein A2075_08270 [Geobacteraceae bacterium GWC2_58_44]|nr:MAG: hypothetical protein A2075_08270 [Geobacteraceae bacterium GWC2_58_44]
MNDHYWRAISIDSIAESPPLKKGDLGGLPFGGPPAPVASWAKSPPTPLFQRGEVLWLQVSTTQEILRRKYKSKGP